MPADTKPLVDLMDALNTNNVDMVDFTSASQVYNFFMVAEQLGRKQSLQNGLNRSLISSIAPVSNAELVKFYVRVDVEPNPPKLGPFINAMNSKFAYKLF